MNWQEIYLIGIVITFVLSSMYCLIESVYYSHTFPSPEETMNIFTLSVVAAFFWPLAYIIWFSYAIGLILTKLNKKS